MKDSRIFMEWLDANGNKIGFNNTPSVTSQGKDDFTEKFIKLYSHIDSVWGGLNIIRCARHTLAIYYGYGQNWYHLIIRYIPTEGCFEINLSERRPSDKLIYAGEADSWAELLDILMQTETIKNRKLCEWVDAKRNKISISGSSATQSIPAKLPDLGHKKKFQKLLDYHKKQISNDRDLISTEIKKLSSYGFEYREVRLAPGSKSETITIVEVDIHDDGEYYAYIWLDGKCVDLSHNKGFDNLLKLLGKYLNIPDKNSIEYSELVEWIDSKGNKISTTESPSDNVSEEVVYIWDMYIDPRDKGTWRSAEKYGDKYDGFVFKTKEDAFHYGREHLYELDDEGELRGDPDDYDIETIAIPKVEVSDYTLRFSGL